MQDTYRRSASAVLRFAMVNDDVLPVQRDRLINDCLWFITEADGKYSTRYRTRGVLDLERAEQIRDWRSVLRHEHVVTRKQLADRIRGGEDPDKVLSDAVACIVTIDEHTLLTLFDKTHEGWDRDRAAGIEVVDMSSGERVI